MAEAATTRSDSAIGARVPRFDAAEKVTGQARYVGDLVLPGMLHGALLLAQHPHARVVRIDTTEAEALPGVKAVVTYRDVPDARYGAIIKDQRLFAKEGEKVTFLGDVIAAVAATTVQTARDAARRIRVDYEVLEPIFDPEAALASEHNLIHPDIESYGVAEGTIVHGNDCGYTTIVKGNIEQGFAEADVVIEERYEVDHSHPAPIETHGMVAQVDASGRATVWSSTQVPFVARSGVADTLRMPLSKVRVIVPTLGGGFGGKCEFAFEAHAVALARKAGRPVRLIFTRAEEFIAPNMTRHGAIVYIKSGIKKDGAITARQATVILDTGGTAAHGPAITEIATMMAAGPYRIPHIKIEGHTAYTNKTSAGSVRAPSGPQVSWASEQHTDSLARAIGMSPYDFRMKNLVDDGDTGPSGQLFGPTGARETLRKAAELIGWDAGGPRADGEGLGLACGWWFTLQMASSVSIKLNDDGTVTLLTGANENGSGAVQGLIHLAAQEMGVAIEDVSVVYQDTDVGGWDGGSSGSQTLFNVGRALHKAAADLRGQVYEVAGEMLEVAPSDLELHGGAVHVRGTPGRSVTLAEVASEATGSRGPLTGRGAISALPMPPEAGAGCVGRVSFPAFVAPAFCTHAARVHVDRETGIVRVVEAATVQEVGRAINPLGIEGQMEGGLVHGMGSALTERTHFQDGRTVNAGFMDYKLMTAPDAPSIKVGIVETPVSEGPFGIRGVGEPPVVAITGAIGNAIRDASGVLVTRMPMTPDRVYDALRRQQTNRNRSSAE